MGILASLDNLKRASLKEVLSNLYVPSAYIKSNLEKYIRYGSSITFGWSEFIKFDTEQPKSADFNAKVAISYLELCSIYVLNYTSTQTFQQLSILSKGKYKYIISKYKEVYLNLKSKALYKDYKYNLFVDFSVPKQIYTKAFSDSNFNITDTSSLAYVDLLSLPIYKRDYIRCSDINLFISDSTVSNITQSIGNGSALCILNRLYGSKVGIVTAHTHSSKGITVIGSTNGYISELIYIKMVNVNKIITQVPNEIVNFEYTFSMDGYNWSNVYAGQADISYKIYILADIDSGIEFTISKTSSITKDDVIILTMSYIEIEDSSCKMKFVFNTINSMSYLKLSDISENKVYIKNKPRLYVDELFGSDIDADGIIDNDLEYIIPTNRSVYSVDIDFVQSKGTLVPSIDNKVSYRYEYNVVDVYGVRNKYGKHGSIVFDPLDVEGVSNIVTKANQYTVALQGAATVGTTSIFYSAIITTKYGTCEIPTPINTWYSYYQSEYDDAHKVHYITEPIIVKTLHGGTSQLYTLKCRPDYNKTPIFKPKVFNMKTSQEIYTVQYQDDKDNYAIAFNNTVNSYFSVRYPITVGKNDDILNSDVSDNDTRLWNIMSNNVAYMIYKDVEGNVAVAVRMLKDGDNTKLTTLTGKIYGKITMQSADADYISPYVSEYSISAV